MNAQRRACLGGAARRTLVRDVAERLPDFIDQGDEATVEHLLALLRTLARQRSGKAPVIDLAALRSRRQR